MTTLAGGFGRGLAGRALLVTGGLCLLLLMVAALRPTRHRPVPPRPQRAPIVAPVPPDTPDGRAWQVAAARHPHARMPGWVYKPGWGTALGCTGPFAPRYFFVRICPQNGALTLDWAQVWPDVRHEEYLQSVAPEPLPPQVEGSPAIPAGEARDRAWRELRACGCRLNPRRWCRRPPVLRMVRDGSRIRLAYELYPEDSPRVVHVDAINGDVGGMRYASMAVHLSDALRPEGRRQPGHQIERLFDRWVGTTRPSP